MDYYWTTVGFKMDKTLLLTWLLSFILLVASQSSTTNEIMPSTTVSQTATSISVTPTLASASSVNQSVSQTQNVSTSATNNASINLATVSRVNSTSYLPSSSILSTVTISPSTSSMDANNSATASLNSSSIPKTTAPPQITPTPVSVKETNVTCTGAKNSSDCKTYTGQDSWSLPTSVIIGIACGSAALVLLLVVAIAICCTRKKHQLSGSKADLSAYWEDNVTLSYINGHVDLPRDYPDEMISLDNDSFLNSLDNTCMPNKWAADNAKHTNF
ncbi:hypothetical protein SNE40_006285 [Patella caerulea]|uniref:Uncharacterized protein n=1 Tax=Patella caerulea TaxID=87958 RepID=A0AAN8QAZ8_PATCE